MNLRVHSIRIVSLLALLLLLPWTAMAAAAAPAAGRPNVLFIAVDDLRPQLGCYGQSQIVSPNLDQLASEGILFRRSYCMVPTCGASRASLLTGIRPARDRFVNYLAWAEKDAPGITTLNTHFHNNGYYTVSNGKIFHHPTDSAAGWSEPAWRPKRDAIFLGNYAKETVLAAAKDNPRGRGPAFESADVPDDFYPDGKLARKAVADLRRLKDKKEPFFLAVGFFKPHLPFVAPTKYWDLYSREEIHLPSNRTRPTDAPDAAIHTWGELRAYADIPPEGPLTDDMARTLIHGYYACVSYTDAQIGRVLDELERLDLAENTIVIVWGDHGWNLGEHTLWCKHCCFETSMRAPIILRAPGIAGGKTTDGLTEFIDIYPSLCDLAGLSKPDHLQGTSFVPLLNHPDMAWKSAAIGRYGNGDTIRTEGHRYTTYATSNGKPLGRMLYDHKVDSGET
ncbi:MAG TPA: sulfatase, partial [Thermoguttaceae bacterium]|nr:sulfatase [Thermoguttaceae bacterium]